MDSSAAPNQGYWFVLREDQGNVIFSSNSVEPIIPEPQATVTESRYIVDSSTGRLYPEPAPAVTSHHPDWDEQTKAKEFWDTTKIKLLLTLSLEHKDPRWDDISATVGATPDECTTKYRHLRRTYLRLLRKKRAGKDIKWTHYNACDEVFARMDRVPAESEAWSERRVRSLLACYVQQLPRLRSPDTLHKHVWADIAAHLHVTPYSAYHKYKNLKRAYFHWLANKQRKAADWPYRHYFERIYHEHAPPPRPWHRDKVDALLAAYADVAHQFHNPKLLKKHLWKQIAAKVGESPPTCDRKYRNLKQTYLKLKQKVDNGATTKWRYYKHFEQIYANATRYIDMDDSRIVYRDPDADYIARLLTFYIQNKCKFRDPLTKNKTIWRRIAPSLGLAPEECDKKFRNLKQTYIRLAWKKKKTGDCGKWPYFGYFEQIFTTPPLETRRGDGAAVHDVAATRRHRDRQFECLAAAAEESNRLQRDRNHILRAMLHRHHTL